MPSTSNTLQLRQLHFVAIMYCASTPDLLTLCQHEEPIRYQQNQSGTYQLQDSRFTITILFLWALHALSQMVIGNKSLAAMHYIYIRNNRRCWLVATSGALTELALMGRA